MNQKITLWIKAVTILSIVIFTQATNAITPLNAAAARDLPEIKKAEVIRHLGVPYANFVTGSGDGLDIEMIQLFADWLGVKYEYVKTDWKHVITDLTGKQIHVQNGKVEVVGKAPVRGDIIANGLTIIPWRKEVINFSTAIFPTQVWLLAKAESSMKPITPTGDIDKDITLTIDNLQGKSTMGKQHTCLDPDLYNLSEKASSVLLFKGALNELAPAVMNGLAESTILDVPDALIALEKWPGQLKVIGPASELQKMGVGFALTSPLLQEAFEKFLKGIKEDGTYFRLVKKYYPSIFGHYPVFFEQQKTVL